MQISSMVSFKEKKGGIYVGLVLLLLGTQIFMSWPVPSYAKQSLYASAGCIKDKQTVRTSKMNSECR